MTQKAGSGPSCCQILLCSTQHLLPNTCQRLSPSQHRAGFTCSAQQECQEITTGKRLKKTSWRQDYIPLLKTKINLKYIPAPAQLCSCFVKQKQEPRTAARALSCFFLLPIPKGISCTKKTHLNRDRKGVQTPAGLCAVSLSPKFCTERKFYTDLLHIFLILRMCV